MQLSQAVHEAKVNSLFDVQIDISYSDYEKDMQSVKGWHGAMHGTYNCKHLALESPKLDFTVNR